MRRKDREVTDVDKIFEIVSKCSVAHVGMAENGKPYVVALNFGCERQGDALVLYFHCAYEGRKMDILKKNPDVFFQMDCVNELIPGTKENPCVYGWRYDSVTGSGRAEFIEDPAEKANALTCIIHHLGKTDETFTFPKALLAKTCVFKIRSADITGKHRE